MKILWLTNIPSPYRVSFFNELGKYCSLTVLFEKQSSVERDESWKKFNTEHFTSIFLKGKSVGVAEAFCPEVLQYLHKNVYDHIVVTNFSDPTGMLAITMLRIKNIPYIVESDGGFAGNGKGMKEKIKSWILSGACKYFSAAEIHDKYYLTYGAKKFELVRYPFTSLRDEDILSEPVSVAQKEELRKQLRMTEKKIILAVGQFIPRKGYDLLIQAMAQLEKEIGCYIIGGNPTQEYIELVDTYGLKNVHFLNFKTKNELNKYYMAADIFVHPTREDIWGLVVNEAMAKGLPVITTDRCVAGLELIKNESVGRIVPVENIDLLVKAIKGLIVRECKSENVLSVIRKYTIESMAKRHMEVLVKECEEKE